MLLEQPLTRLEEAELVEAARRDASAFEILYRRYVTDVYRYCFVHVGNQAEAEDLVAQTFLTALESLPRYRGRGSFAAWLFGIARHKCADHHRGRYAEQEKAGAMFEALPIPMASNPEQQAYLNGVLDCLQQSLSQLTTDRREALRLRFWGGLSIRETAQVMRRTQGAVKMLVARAISDLQQRCLPDEAI